MGATKPSPSTDAFLGVSAIAGRDADRTVVWLSGEHDIATDGALRETLAQAIALDDADLVVDLSAVQFMGASTVAVLVRARARLRRQSRSLELRSPSRCARRILGLCGQADLIEPSPVGAAGMAGTAGALGTWVAVPATTRVDRPSDGSPPQPRGATAPVRAGRVTPARKASSADGRSPADMGTTTTVASRGGP
jgi:anti-anti-sigma factor